MTRGKSEATPLTPKSSAIRKDVSLPTPRGRQKGFIYIRKVFKTCHYLLLSC